jgi:retron-type reverse transcriptase
VLNALEPAFEAVFLDGSFGYRPGRSVVQAVDRVLQERDRGYQWLLDADIRSCFESLEHPVVLEHVRQVVRHPLLLRLIELWLGAAARPAGDRPVEIRLKRGVYVQVPPAPRPRLGVPLGAVISPLLCNVVLHQLDLALDRAGWHWVRYADDFVVLTRTQAEAEQAWEEVEAALRGLRLQLNPEKTRLASFAGGFKFLGVTFKGDTYSYIYDGRRYEVRGRNVSVLWNNHIPEPYGWDY